MKEPGMEEPADTTLEVVRNCMQYAYPCVLLAIFLAVGTWESVSTALREGNVAAPAKGPDGKPLPVSKRRRKKDDKPDKKKAADKSGTPALRAFFQYLMLAATTTFFVVGVDIAHRALWHRSVEGEHGWWCGEPKTVFVLGSTFFYMYFSITLFDWPTSPSLVHLITWAFAFIGDGVIYSCDAYILTHPHKVMVDLRQNLFTMEDRPRPWDLVDLAVTGVRMVILLGLLIVCLLAIRGRNQTQDKEKAEQDNKRTADETTPLISNHQSSYGGHESHNSTNGYANGTTNGTANGTTVTNTNGTANTCPRNITNGSAKGSAGMAGPKVKEHAIYRSEKLPNTTWIEYFRGYAVFFPYMWPKEHPMLQVAVVVCFGLVMLQRVVNIAVPYQLGLVTNDLIGDGEERPTMPWLSISLLILFKMMQGTSGLLGSARTLLWIPVSQHTYRSLTTSAFEHVHSLGLDFHLGMRTGEVLGALNKGGAVNNFLEQVTFQVFPMLIDLFVAISYFYISFDAVFACLVCVIVFYYLFLTIRMAQTTAEERRAMSNADREEQAVKNDSIVGYETVKYFNAEDFEFGRYRQAVENFQAHEAKVQWGISTMNICQSVVFMTGMLVAMLLGAYQVSFGARKVGDFVALMTYLNQLQGPLNYFGTFYRNVQQAMISGERLLELFRLAPTVVDRPGVASLSDCNGHVEFNNVGFTYGDDRPALQNLTFECAPGTTTALVGESGGGKSTLFRLMYRYFNCTAGTIRIDGHDVKDVTIDSVRRHIGVVPQDSVLFNDTLMFNLKYANQAATDEDVYEACEAASIHHKILEFKEGYNTKVGERGLRLSGGEKQRVALARTLLKNPKIIMLDEATSALDTQTEQAVKARLKQIAKGRTSLIIAHRLSTITHADQILVMKGGQIMEKGNHEGLLAKKDSMYAAMWNKQVKAEKAAENARNATLRAEKLLRKANIGSSEASGSGKRPPQNDEHSSSSDESTHKHKAKADEGANKRPNKPDEATSDSDESTRDARAKPHDG